MILIHSQALQNGQFGINMIDPTFLILQSHKLKALTSNKTEMKAQLSK